MEQTGKNEIIGEIIKAVFTLGIPMIVRAIRKKREKKNCCCSDQKKNNSDIGGTKKTAKTSKEN